MNLLLAARQCQHPAAKIADGEADNLLVTLDGWRREGPSIVKMFSFPDHYHLLAFVNAVAWISHRANHHPDVHYGMNQLMLRYSTHSCQGLSENDFICAAKLDILQAI
jgi:4a-hydroxytetrahydrobiopterin dehydratase